MYPATIETHTSSSVVDSNGVEWFSTGCVDYGNECVETLRDDTGDYLAVCSHEDNVIHIVYGPYGVDAPPPGYEEIWALILDDAM